MAFVGYVGFGGHFRGGRTDCGRRRSVTVCAAGGVPRVGHGFDLHRLEPNNKLILGGVLFEHDVGCVGHSDGDVVYHCVVDAVLGALSLPDIGQIFPDKDPKWKGAPSDVFMRAAKDMMFEAGYEIGNLDVTVILERPKMSPHKDKMRLNIAELLGCDLENVNLKAKTHEKVDAVGENRAVACHTVTLLVPRKPDSLALEEEVTTAQPVEEPLSAYKSMTEGIFGVVSNRVDRVMDTRYQEPHALDTLYSTVLSRRGGDPSQSWTAKLFCKGRKKIAQKVGEEGVETVIAAINDDKEELVKESADLLYHLSVLWADAGIDPTEVWTELKQREGTSGIVEKSSRTN